MWMKLTSQSVQWEDIKELPFCLKKELPRNPKVLIDFSSWLYSLDYLLQIMSYFLFAEENIINSPTENGTSSHTGDHAKLSTIHKSCQADLQEIKANESQTKDQSSQTSPFNEATNLKETVGDAIDSKSTIRQTLIIKKVIIKEIVHRGKVIKKTVEEVGGFVT